MGKERKGKEIEESSGMKERRIRDRKNRGKRENGRLRKRRGN